MAVHADSYINEKQRVYRGQGWAIYSTIYCYAYCYFDIVYIST